MLYSHMKVFAENGRRFGSLVYPQISGRMGGDDHDRSTNHIDFVNPLGFSHKKLTAPSYQLWRSIKLILNLGS
jgi:hypothetical protein